MENGWQCRLGTKLKWDRHEQGGRKKHGDLISNDRLPRWTSGKSDAMEKFLSGLESRWGKGREERTKERIFAALALTERVLLVDGWNIK